MPLENRNNLETYAGRGIAARRVRNGDETVDGQPLTLTFLSDGSVQNDGLGGDERVHPVGDHAVQQRVFAARVRDGVQGGAVGLLGRRAGRRSVDARGQRHAVDDVNGGRGYGAVQGGQRSGLEAHRGRFGRVRAEAADRRGPRDGRPEPAAGRGPVFAGPSLRRRRRDRKGGHRGHDDRANQRRPDCDWPTHLTVRHGGIRLSALFDYRRERVACVTIGLDMMSAVRRPATFIWFARVARAP